MTSDDDSYNEEFSNSNLLNSPTLNNRIGTNVDYSH